MFVRLSGVYTWNVKIRFVRVVAFGLNVSLNSNACRVLFRDKYHMRRIITPFLSNKQNLLEDKTAIHLLSSILSQCYFSLVAVFVVWFAI